MKREGRRHRQDNGGKEKPGGLFRGATRVLARGLAAVGELMTTSDTDALTMLSAQHKHVDKLFAQLERAVKRDPRRARALVDELAEVLTVHAAIEEQHFYPGVRTPRTEPLVAESFQEHRQMKRALADLVAAARSGRDLPAKVSVLKEEVVHHAKKEEEAKLFPLVRTILDADQREALGQEMLAAMVDLQERPLAAPQPAPA
jgi:hemerythrin superfamily protein